jgi:hypothetical protein
MRKARIWRAFLIEERKFSKNKTAWLGREDSNLRMVESKSAASRLATPPQPLTPKGRNQFGILRGRRVSAARQALLTNC